MTGTVYVFDEQAQHVQVYDAEGVYVETLGGRGEGPGEFSRAEASALSCPTAGSSCGIPATCGSRCSAPARESGTSGGTTPGNARFHGSPVSPTGSAARIVVAA